jgi:transposase InsO family protein
MSAPDRTAMLDRAHADLSIRRQCRLLGLARSNVYRPAPDADTGELVIMRRLDELFLAWPFFGSRRMTAMLRAEGQRINRKRVRRLMRLMGLTALGPKPQTSKPAPGHKIYPYLLRGLVIERATQVWAADITYVPIGRGFLYLVAIMDWASRAVLAWRLSNTLDADFCVRALEDALARFGRPAIFNTDQGSQFTSTAFTSVLQRTALAGQRLHRAAVAIAQVRGGLPEELCRRSRGARRDRGLDRVLQRHAAPSGARRPNSDDRVADGDDGPPARERRGHDAPACGSELGRPLGVAHSPPRQPQPTFDAA